MRNYIFIKDETYSSNLYTNFTEYIAKDDDLKCSFGGSEKYKIKLMNGGEARGLINKHPLMIDPLHINNEYQNELALVSFGGCIHEIYPLNLITKAFTYGSATLASFHQGNNEAEVLAKAELYAPHELKKEEGLGYIYLTVVHLEGTNIYYMILNPTLVSCAGHIEIEGDPWIEQIKGLKDTIKDSIFTMDVTPQQIGNHIISGGLCVIDMLKDSIIQPEDREEIFKQLKLGIIYKEEGCAHMTSHQGMSDGTHVSIAHDCDTPLVIEVQNKLLGSYINDREKLKWEYIITSLKD